MSELVHHLAGRIQSLGRRAAAALHEEESNLGAVKVLAVVPARRLTYRYLGAAGDTLRIEIQLPYCPPELRGASGDYRLAGVAGEALDFFVSVRLGKGEEGVEAGWVSHSQGTR
jgi:hypothetical protein